MRNGNAHFLHNLGIETMIIGIDNVKQKLDN